MRVDVCVVGAGFAGLAAARAAGRRGASVVVLEARDRIGGRTETTSLPSGLRVDIGGAWVGHGQDRLRALASEFGAQLYPTYHAGDTLLVADGTTRRYKGSTPHVGVRAIASLALGMTRLDRMSKKISVDAPWTSKGAEGLDAISAAEWLDKKVRNKTANGFMKAFIGGFFCCGADEVSMLGVLFPLATNAGVQHTLAVEGGGQQDLIVGGTNAISGPMSSELGDALRLSTPVRRITQTPTGVVLEADDLSVEADHAIVTIPIPLLTKIAFDPPLPEARRALATSLPTGCVVKSLAVYDEPFWRADGLSGESGATSGATVELSLDSTAPDGPGVLTCFTFGPNARTHGTLAPDVRRKAVLDDLAKRFGPRALEPIDFIDKDWYRDNWSAGCFAAHFPVGVMTRYGHALREPFGRIHWAGVETTTEHYGYIEGAIRSGESAAAATAAS